MTLRKLIELGIDEENAFYITRELSKTVEDESLLTNTEFLSEQAVIIQERRKKPPEFEESLNKLKKEIKFKLFPTLPTHEVPSQFANSFEDRLENFCINERGPQSTFFTLFAFIFNFTLDITVDLNNIFASTLRELSKLNPEQLKVQRIRFVFQDITDDDAPIDVGGVLKYVISKCSDEMKKLSKETNYEWFLIHAQNQTLFPSPASNPTILRVNLFLNPKYLILKIKKGFWKINRISFFI